MMRLLLGCLSLVSVSHVVNAAEPIDFRRDVQPILSNHCWACHGVDEKARKAKLRLDSFDEATRKTADHAAAIIPQQPNASELVKRILSADAADMMPPPAFKKPLTPRQKDILKQWIAEGAKFAKHWAFEPPQRPEIPKVNASNPVDAFIRHRLQQEGLKPSPAAAKGQWLRRVTFDLTGLPPTLAELDAYLADKSPTAEETVVDRLLKSTAYAERMAMHWLDLARYADTNGYNNDEMRTMWPWRDWVINSFASGMKYDQFLTEQLAGDLLPDATLSQRVATGFVRNHVLTTEGGIIEEEYQAEYVADRLHTMSTVFMAMSVQCARCHDHKYDPISQKDFYQLAAYFNNIPDKIVGYGAGVRMAEPVVKVPTVEQTKAIAKLKEEQTTLAAQLKAHQAKLSERAAAWATKLPAEQIDKLPSVDVVAQCNFANKDANIVLADLGGYSRGKVVGTAKRGTSLHGPTLELDGKTHVDLGQLGNFEADQPFTIAVWVRPDSATPGAIIAKIDAEANFRGYDLMIEDGKLAVHLSHKWPTNGFKVMSTKSLKLKEWHRLVMSYDGSRKPEGVKFTVNGEAWEAITTNGKSFSESIRNNTPLHIGRRSKPNPFTGAIADLAIFSRVMSQADVTAFTQGKWPNTLTDLLRKAPAERTAKESEQLTQYYARFHDLESRRLEDEQKNCSAKITAIEAQIPATMVMQEMPNRRKTHILIRGEYDKKGPEVQPGVPTLLANMPVGVPNSRLGLAKWLTSPTHPLTARVAVNRWWEMLFGMGLVETSEDFGIQGANPTHPELLDWLATELIRTGWDTRAMLKLLVLSDTYRQSANLTPELLKRDPANKLLARGPRHRLSAEMVRDAALANSGLLVNTVGGPSVKPYQPDGLWEDVSVERRDKYKPDYGDGLYRRSLYTFWKRTCPPPGMSAFDAPDRETCVIRRARTNTPLQALALLNDPTYVEAARKLGERLLNQPGDTKTRIELGFSIVLCRQPTPNELKIITQIHTEAQRRFQSDAKAVDQLLAVGYSKPDARLTKQDVATWAVVAGVLQNLDEAITKP